MRRCVRLLLLTFVLRGYTAPASTYIIVPYAYQIHTNKKYIEDPVKPRDGLNLPPQDVDLVGSDDQIPTSSSTSPLVSQYAPAVVEAAPPASTPPTTAGVVTPAPVQHVALAASTASNKIQTRLSSGRLVTITRSQSPQVTPAPNLATADTQAHCSGYFGCHLFINVGPTPRLTLVPSSDHLQTIEMHGGSSNGSNPLCQDWLREKKSTTPFPVFFPM